ncbi:MAG TPA: cupin domain-containing protein [Vicinamibacteria bacterium]|nr:cupin domain-containing protein [Vicinamibacteria bacterium]
MLAAVRAREGKPVDLGKLAEAHRHSPRRYLEALRTGGLSSGLYRLRKGEEDEQKPHAQEEAYLVLEGSGRFRMGDEDFAVGPGYLFTVPARVEHRFHSIADDLLLLVFFAPAEGREARDE